MAKKRGQKTGNLAKANHSHKPRPTDGSNNKQSSANTASIKEPTSKQKFSLWEGWKNFWSFAGPIATMTGLWINLTPWITIEPGANIDPQRQYATQILITNRGHVPVYNLEFSCGVGVGRGWTHIQGISSAPDLRPIATLAAGQAVTRSCDAGLLVKGNTRIRFQMTYQWPLIYRSEVKDAIFDVRKGSPGYFLVPDNLP